MNWLQFPKEKYIMNWLQENSTSKQLKVILSIYYVYGHMLIGEFVKV